jgi:PAS domain S-box-containing protein
VDVRSIHEKLRDYQMVIDTMHAGLVAEDIAGKIVFVNQRLLHWLSYEEHEVIGHHVDMLAPAELRDLLHEDRKAGQQGDLRARLLAIRRKDSTTFPVVLLPQHIIDERGDFDGLFSILVDLGAVMTAKPVGDVTDVRANLGRIATELHTICLSVCGSTKTAPAVPFGFGALKVLSPREEEVLALLMAGARVPAIADRLHISQHTVRNHLKSMYRKLGVGSQSELIERVRSLMEAPVVDEVLH